MGKTALFSEETMERLLQKYTPVLLLHKNEKFLPVPVECFFEVAEIKKGDEMVQKLARDIKNQFVNTTHRDRLIIKSTPFKANFRKKGHKITLLDQQQKWFRKKGKLAIYGHWAQSSDEKFLYLTLTYYFFYLGNIITFPHPYYSHDCDWEMVRIFLKSPIFSIEPKVAETKFLEDGIPESILFQQHGHDPKSFDLVIKWSSMIKKAAVYGTHPAILVGNGTHASSPSFDVKEDDLDPQFKSLIKYKSIWRKIINSLIKIVSDEYYNARTKLPLRPLTPKTFPKNDSQFSQQTHYQLITLIQNKNANFWVNFQGKWGNQWKFTTSDGIRGPKFFSGFERTFNYTKNPNLQKRDPAYWFLIGVINYNNNDYDKAKSNYFKVLDLLKVSETKYKIQNQYLRIVTINALAVHEEATGNIDQAIFYFEESLKFYRKQQDEVGIAGSLRNLGVLTHVQGKINLAQNYCQEGLNRSRKLKNKSGEAYSLYDLGRFAHEKGEMEQAKNYYHKSLNIFQKLQERDGEMASLSQLGKFAKDRGMMKKAHQYHQKSLNISRELNDKRAEGISLNNLGILAHEQGKIEQAQQYYEESLSIDKELGDKVGEAVSLLDLGRLAFEQGQIRKAKAHYLKSLKISRELKNKSREAIARQGLGRLAQSQGQCIKAKIFFLQHFKICRELRNLVGIGLGFQNLGRIAQEEENIEKAQKYYEKSRKIFQKLKDTGREASSLHHLAVIAQNKGQIEKAKKRYHEILDIVRTLQDKVGEGSCLHSLGTIAHQRKRFEEALKLYQASQKIFQKLELKAGEARSLLQQGRLAQDKKQTDLAKKLYHKSLPIFRKIRDRVEEANNLSQLGKLAHEQKQMKEARKFYKESLSIFEKLKNEIGIKEISNKLKQLPK